MQGGVKGVGLEGVRRSGEGLLGLGNYRTGCQVYAQKRLGGLPQRWNSSVSADISV